MAVEATITGSGSFVGGTTNLIDYSYSEEATPINPAASVGGVGQFNFSAVENTDGGQGTIMLFNSMIELNDGSNGKTTGYVSGINSSDGIAAITADSRLSILLATRTAAPTNTSVADTVRYYLSLAGVTTDIEIDPVFEGGAVALPGWTAVIWDKLREFALVNSAEISLVSNKFVLRPIRQRVAQNQRNISQQWAVTKGQLAQTIEVNYYNNRYAVNNLAYPTNGWNSDVSVYQVDAGEVLTVNAPIDASLISVTQPVVKAFVGRYETGSVYAVVGKDGLPIPPSQWSENGGNVVVTVGEDRRSLDFQITGARTTQGPFRIAVASGPSDVYSSLRVQGTGTFFTQEMISLATGVAPTATAQLVGITVDNQFISTIDQAYNYGIRAAAQYGGPAQNISINTVGINRSDDAGNVRYPTFDEFNTGVYGVATDWTGKTFDQFNTEWSGKTFDEFNAYYLALVSNEFTNQAFGNVAGARVQYRDAWYRIDTASIGPTNVSYTATSDTLFSDFNSAWELTEFEKSGPNSRTTAYTFDDFSTIMVGRTFDDLAVTPLWRTYAGYAANQPRS